MELHYVLINFLLLALLIFLFFRKLIVNIFSKRRQGILEDLKKAEEIENQPMPKFSEPEFSIPKFEDSSELLELEANVKERVQTIKDFGVRECNEIHRIMIEKTKKQFFKTMENSVAEVFSKEPYRSASSLKRKSVAKVRQVFQTSKSF